MSAAGGEPRPSPSPDPVRGLVGFTAVLRHAGLPVTTERVTAFLTAVDTLGTGREQVYRAGLHTLCADPDDLPRYERAFVEWFDDGGPPPARRVRTPPQAAAPVDAAAHRPGRRAPRRRRPARRCARPPRTPRCCATTTWASCRSPSAPHLRALLALLRPEPPTRPSRRRLAGPPRRRRPPRGRCGAALRTDGELCVLARRDRSRRPRKVVLLVDVSGSMEPYADALLRFAHVVVRRAPAATEVFTLGTRLTRITRELRLRDPEHALAAAGRAIPDWSGGTRLGEVLAAFVDRWGRRGAARRAVVVVFSDGWERGDTALLGTQLARLRRLAHRLVWVNPHVGKAGYAPGAGRDRRRAALP